MKHTIRLNSRYLARAAACLLVLAAGAGCTLFHNMGTGQHLDAPRDHAPAKKSVTRRNMVVEVTTDASGAVDSVWFVRSSGEDSLDGFVANSIRNNWPKIPSRTTEAELTYSIADGFSQPRMISSRPAP